MSFADHIGELRVCLIKALLGLALGTLACFFVAAPLTDLIKAPAERELTQYYRGLHREELAEFARKVRAGTARQTFTPLDVTLSGTALDRLGRQVLSTTHVRRRPAVAEQRAVRLKSRVSWSSVEAGALPLANPEASLITLSAMEGFLTWFKVAMVAGLVLSSPWVFYQIWVFVAAGLYAHERRYVYVFMPFSLGLFLAGVALCYFGILPFGLKFLLRFGGFLGVRPTIRLTEWMQFACILPVLFGASFQVPLIMLFLERIGVADLDLYTHYRRHAILVIFIVAAFLTPGEADVPNIVGLAVPMYLLYELGIVLTRSLNRARQLEPVPGI